MAACLPQDQATPTVPCTTTRATKTLGLAYVAGSDAVATFTHGNRL